MTYAEWARDFRQVSARLRSLRARRAQLLKLTAAAAKVSRRPAHGVRAELLAELKSTDGSISRWESIQGKLARAEPPKTRRSPAKANAAKRKARKKR